MKDYLAKLLAAVEITPTGCWEWKLYRLPNGYGRTRYRGANILAHRLSWILHHPRLPIDGLLVCHKCDNPPCCNPKHLFRGTDGDNARDSFVKGRRKPVPWLDRTKQRVQKLTHDQVDEIRSSDESSSALAARFGCSYQNIYMIRKGLRKRAPRT